MTWLRAITASIPSEGACLGNTTSYGADPDVFAGLTRRPMSTRSPASNASRSRWRSPPSTSEASTSMSTTSTPGGPPGPGCASVDEPVSRHKIQPPRRIAPPSPSLPGLRSTPSQGLPRRWQASGAFGAARRVRPGPPRATWPCRQARLSRCRHVLGRKWWRRRPAAGCACFVREGTANQFHGFVTSNKR